MFQCPKCKENTQIMVDVLAQGYYSPDDTYDMYMEFSNREADMNDLTECCDCGHKALFKFFIPEDERPPE